MTSKTAADAREMNANGAAYQRLALQILPVLVRQVNARQTIFYSDLATEVGISNPRTLNWPLGAVGNSLAALGTEWAQAIPRIQALVVSREDGLPGPGFMEAFVDPQVLKGANRQFRRQIIDTMLLDVFAYPRWHDVLAHFQLEPLQSVPTRLIHEASVLLGGGESDAHRELKHYIATHPQSVGVTDKVLKTTIEYPLPSGDTIDVLIQTKRVWLAVEVKSRISREDDLTRGVFQCVKYEAVLDATLRAQGVRSDVRAVLAVGGPLPTDVRRLATILGVDVQDRVTELRPTGQP